MSKLFLFLFAVILAVLLLFGFAGTASATSDEPVDEQTTEVECADGLEKTAAGCFEPGEREAMIDDLESPSTPIEPVEELADEPVVDDQPTPTEPVDPAPAPAEPAPVETPQPTGVDAGTGGQLPVTGIEAPMLAVLGFVLLLTGIYFVGTARRYSE